MATATKKTSPTATRKRPATARVSAPARKPVAAPAPAVPAAGTTAKPPKAAAKPAAKAAKADKPKKPKLVRDSYTIPKAEYALLQMLKDRAAKGGAPAKKSQLLRAGIQALAGMQDGAFLAAVAAVPTLKTGRPAKA